MLNFSRYNLKSGSETRGTESKTRHTETRDPENWDPEMRDLGTRDPGTGTLGHGILIPKTLEMDPWELGLVIMRLRILRAGL